MVRNRLLEKYSEVVRMDGLQTNKNATFGLNGATPTVTFNGPVATNNTLTQAGITTGTTQTLASAATVSLTPTSTVITHTPTQNETINFAAPPGPGFFIQLEIVTSGVSSFTLTFGTNTKNQGTLATGTVSAKTFFICYVSDASNWIESCRTTAM